MTTPDSRFAAKLGNQVQVANPGALLVAPFPKRFQVTRTDDSWKEARLWAVTLDLLGSGVDWIADVPGAIARVTWGTGGATHEAWVDWRRGARFVVHGATVAVDLWLLNTNDWGTAPGNLQGWPVTFRASIVPEQGQQIPGTLPPTLTVAVPTVASGGGASDWITIPPFARRATMYGTDAAFGTIAAVIDFFTGTPAAPVLFLYRINCQAPASGGISSLSADTGIPRDATICRIVNVAAADLLYPKVEFALQL